MEITILCNQVSEGTLCHFCHILWITSKSLGPAHTHREGIIQRHEGAGGGDYGRPSSKLHTTLTFQWNQAAALPDG